ncbi:hypothetical protein D3C72_854050 [compost metagenome]
MVILGDKSFNDILSLFCFIHLESKLKTDSGVIIVSVTFTLTSSFLQQLLSLDSLQAPKERITRPATMAFILIIILT